MSDNDVAELMQACDDLELQRDKARERVAELETELRKWIEHYAKPDDLTVSVPRYQIERLFLKERP